MGLGRDLLALGAMAEVKRIRKATESQATAAVQAQPAAHPVRVGPIPDWALALMTQAHAEGRTAGQEAGFAAGYKAGYDAGYVKGVQDERG